MPAELVSAVRGELQLVEVGVLDGVVGVRPADPVAVTDADEGGTREGNAAGVQGRGGRVADHEVRFHPLIDAQAGDRLVVAPRQVRVAHQHGIATGALLRRERPAVRSFGRQAGRQGVGRGRAARLPRREQSGDVVLLRHDREVDCLLLAGQDVRRLQRQDLPDRRGDGVAVGRRVLVRARDEGVEHRPLEVAAFLHPGNGAIGDALRAHLRVALDVRVVRAGAEILGQAAACGGDVGQQRLRLVLHLGITVAAHDGEQVGAVDVRDAVGVPEDLAPALGRAAGRGGAGRGKRECDGSCTPERAMAHVRLLSPVSVERRLLALGRDGRKRFSRRRFARGCLHGRLRPTRNCCSC